MSNMRRSTVWFPIMDFVGHMVFSSSKDLIELPREYPSSICATAWQGDTRNQNNNQIFTAYSDSP